MRVFNFQEGKLTLNDSLTLLPVVKELSSLEYNAKFPKDAEGRGRKRLELELQYVYYVYSRISPYKAYEEKDRKEKAIELLGLPDKWKESDKLKLLIKEVLDIENNSDTKRALRAVRSMLQSLIKHIEGVDFNAETDDGKSKYDVNKYVAMASKVSELLDKLKELEEKADAEDNLQSNRIWGGGKKGNREDRRQFKESVA
jgi:hypothetical protein